VTKGVESVYLGDVYCRNCGQQLVKKNKAGRPAHFCNQKCKNEYHNRKRLLAQLGESEKLLLQIRKLSMERYSMLVTQPLNALGVEYGGYAAELAWRAITAARNEDLERFKTGRV